MGLFQSGERQYIEQLWEQNKGLIYMIAKRYASPLNPIDDLCQIGFLGLIKAAEGFDSTLGYKFTSYASKAIMGGIYRSLYHTDDYSLDYKHTNKQGEKSTLSEKVIDPNAIDPEESSTDEHIVKQLRKTLFRDMKERLSKRERAIIIMRYFSLEPVTLAQIGKKYGTTPQYISEICQKAFSKLRRNNKHLKQLASELLDIRTDPYKRRSGLTHFKLTGNSPVEEAVFERERIRKKIERELNLLDELTEDHAVAYYGD